MTISFVNLSDQLADIFTKSLRGLRIKYICNKLSAYDLYALALRGVLSIIGYSIGYLFHIISSDLTLSFLVYYSLSFLYFIQFPLVSSFCI